MKSKITELLKESIEVHNKLLGYSNLINDISKEIITALKNNKKVLICGNGGSAADAQHIAGEFVNRFNFDRKSLPAIALTTDTSVITAIGNDSDFKYIFSKQIDCLGNEGDILIAISTSGNSSNIMEAIKSAKKNKMIIIIFTGKDGGLMKNEGDHIFIAPSNNTPRIQECHITVIHIICHIIEEELFKP